MKTLISRVVMWAVTAGLLSAYCVAQSGGGSATGNASVSPGQVGAGATANQSVQASGASASANASAQAEASHQREARPEHKAKGDKGTSGSAAASGGSTSAALSSGTNLQAELVKPIDARKAKPGDEVTAKLTQDVKSNGKTVAHRGDRLTGHVTEAQAHTKDHAESKLGIVFDKAILKGGEEVSFNSMIQAVAPPATATLATAADENASLASAGGSRREPGSGSGGGGLLGGATATATGAVSGATNAVGGTASGAARGALSTASQAAGGLTAEGKLTGASQGAIGLPGMVLSQPVNVAGSAQSSAQGSLITSTSRSVRLDSGTQMLLQVTGSQE